MAFFTFLLFTPLPPPFITPNDSFLSRWLFYAKPYLFFLNEAHSLSGLFRTFTADIERMALLKSISAIWMAPSRVLRHIVGVT